MQGENVIEKGVFTYTTGDSEVEANRRQGRTEVSLFSADSLVLVTTSASRRLKNSGFSTSMVLGKMREVVRLVCKSSGGSVRCKSLGGNLQLNSVKCGVVQKGEATAEVCSLLPQ